MLYFRFISKINILCRNDFYIKCISMNVYDRRYDAIDTCIISNFYIIIVCFLGITFRS